MGTLSEDILCDRPASDWARRAALMEQELSDLRARLAAAESVDVEGLRKTLSFDLLLGRHSGKDESRVSCRVSATALSSLLDALALARNGQALAEKRLEALGWNKIESVYSETHHDPTGDSWPYWVAYEKTNAELAQGESMAELADAIIAAQEQQ